MSNINFQFYTGGIKSATPKGNISLDRFFYGIKHTKPEMLNLLNRIANATKNGDVETKNTLKNKLIFFTPSINCTKRKYENIINFTGLAPLDFDKLDSVDYAIEFKEHLFNHYPEIISTWLSSSKKGVRAFVKIPICQNPDEYKSYYNAFENEFGKYNGFDTAPKNAVLPLFLSNDPEILVRNNAEIWDKKYIEPEKPKPIKPILIYENQKTDVIYNNAIKSLNRITDAGHPILRATSYTLGGYVGSGYITESDAISFIENQINRNHYLSFDKIKIDTYKKTAKEMIKKGQLNPLTL